jgi:integrase
VGTLDALDPKEGVMPKVMLDAAGRRRSPAAPAGVRGRFAPHRLRHAHAVEMAHEGVPPIVIQRQLGKPIAAAA